MYAQPGQRMTDPSMGGNDGTHHYRAADDETEGERDQYEV
jgi:nuclear transcription factor Y gamma